MKTPYSWLKDYVEIKLSPEELAEKLTMTGSEVTSIEKIGGDLVFEFEITPNRPDCLSVIGIAREVAAITGKKLKYPKTKLKESRSVSKPKVEIKDKNLCPRYTARVIEGVKVGQSPDWLKEKLEIMGLRPVNNVVDITNFVLFETGQPLHAFDFDKIKGREITVRRAKKNEKITTIDGSDRDLPDDALMIADAERSIAVGGVMGSINSEVTESTTDVLLESAYFNPVSIRKTSRKLGLASESSYRFERSVDLGGIATASDRASALILQLCGGKAGAIKDAGKTSLTKKNISLSLKHVKAILGLDISNSIITKILTALGLETKSGSKDKLTIKVPSFRQDLKVDVDIIEEIARIYGYNKFPSTIPAMVGHTQRRALEREVNNLIRDTLISLGLNEIITYSLISRKTLEDMNIDAGSIINVKNPLSSEQEIMRPTLMSGMLETISRNLNRRCKDQKLFELGNVYLSEGPALKEKARFSIGLLGKISGSWIDEGKADFFYSKGIIEAVFEKLGITGLTFDTKSAQNGQEIPLKIGAITVGVLEKSPKKLLANFDIETDVYTAEIEISNLLPLVKLTKRFEGITKFPSATRDLSIVVDEGVLNADVTSLIKETGGDLVIKIEFFDQYRGQQIPAGKKGLSYSMEYQAKDRTLTDKEISALHQQITQALESTMGAQIR